jgi:tetratricopeptide (TPR) repeat protein
MNMRLAVVTVVGTVGALLAAPPVASAQTMEFEEEEAEDTMTFGEEQASGDGEDDQVDAQTGQARKFLKEGKNLYGQKKYDEASLIFHRIIDKDKLAAESVVPEARYELGKTLFRMDLYQGALWQFGQIVSAGASHPYYVPVLNGLLSLSEVIPADPTLRKYLASYVGRFPKQVPEKYRDQYAYLTGRHFYGKLDVPKAVEMLEAVSEQSPLYTKARYILATTHVANYDAQPALEAFKEVLQHLVTRREERGLEAEQTKLLELTHLGMARVFYSTGDYETSLKYYGKIDRGSPRWAQALFEAGWANFQLDRYNKALGNLHSLNSPFFDHAYFPEGPVLAAVIYFYNCKYDRVRHELDNFEYTYNPLQTEMQRILDENPDSSSMFDWYQKLQEGDVDIDSRTTRIIRAALDDKKVKAKFDLVNQVQREVQKIESMPDSWSSSALGESLLQEATLSESSATDEAGGLARQRLKRRVDKLNDLINQKEKVLFEVARAEKGQLEGDIRAGMEVEEQDGDKERFEVGDEKMYWEFDGEYWRDEIGQYVFNIQSQCQR